MGFNPAQLIVTITVTNGCPAVNTCNGISTVADITIKQRPTGKITICTSIIMGKSDSPYQQPPVIRALYFAITELKVLAVKGKQGQPWTTSEDELLVKQFNEGTKITELAKLHGRSYGAIKARLIKLEMLEK